MSDGSLSLSLIQKLGEPVIAGLIIRQAQELSEQWKLVWQENFDQPNGLDMKSWNYDIWPAAKVNRERQHYTSNTDNVRLENGKLIIEAHKEKQGYSSGRIHTKGKQDIFYGRIDVVAKLPAGQGTWAAIWMLSIGW